MPSQLLARVQRLVNPQVARDVNQYEGRERGPDHDDPQPGNLRDKDHEPPANRSPHWAGGTGGVLRFPRIVVIHGTSGFKNYHSAVHSGNRAKTLDPYVWLKDREPPIWYDNRGVAPHFTVEGNGTVLPILGPEDLNGPPRLIYHNTSQNGFALGIESTDFADLAFDPDHNRFLLRLNAAAGVTPATADLAGMKVFAEVVPGDSPDVVLVWFKLDGYDGPGDYLNPRYNPARWRMSFFSEQDYRSLALLCRYLAAVHSIPRTVPTLPYASSSAGAKDTTGNVKDAAVFRTLLLGEQLADGIGARLGLDMNVVRAGGAAWAAQYAPNSQSLAHQRATWEGLFGLPARATPNETAANVPCFQGFHSHEIRGDHACPGPMFDWHRFGREVSDWWWHPFDFAATGPAQLSIVSRPYRQARGTTRYLDYYYDAVGRPADYAAVSATVTPPLTTNAYDEFALAADVSVHALANGVVVAARLNAGRAAGDGFVLIRHEVFLPEPSGQVTYDRAPVPVWSLVRFVDTPGARTDDLTWSNPDWLNRLVVRLRECELAVAYRAAHAANRDLAQAWGYRPRALDAFAAGPQPPTTGQRIERDAVAYRLLANDLTAGNVALFPLDDPLGVTPVRAILGDALGDAGTRPAGGRGIRVEIFSRQQLPGVAGRLQTLSAAGDPWWKDATAASRRESRAEEDLPADGVAWTYSPAAFLAWANAATWRDEWRRYHATGAGATDALPPLPAAPASRRFA